MGSLECYGTPIADLSPLTGCTSLTAVNAGNTQVTAATVAVLQKALPNCKIAWTDRTKAAAAQPDGAAAFTNTLGIEFVRVPKRKSWLGGGGGKPGTQAVEFQEDFNSTEAKGGLRVARVR